MNDIFKFIKKTKQLLKEYVSRNDIVDAIENRKVIYIYYAGDNTVKKGYRTIEPYLIGKSTAGNTVLRAWQQAGASDSNRGIGRTRRPDKDAIPGWRLFYVDGITSIMPTGKEFSTAPQDIRPKYNPNDKQMTQIFVAVQPESENELEMGGTDSIIEPDSTTKKVSVFDKQKDKFALPADKGMSETELIKKNIFDLYELVTKHKKRPAKNYYVVNRDGDYYAVTEKSLNKFKDAEVLGNLKELFNKYSENVRPSKAFFNKQRDEFKRAIQ